MSRVRIMLRLGWLCLLACCIQSGCAQKPSEEDAKMLQAAEQLVQAIDNYHRDTAVWPEQLSQVDHNLPGEVAWPINPYNRQPIADTGSPDFDPATSIGNVYYQRILRDEEQTNYMLHVFGKKGKLKVLGHAALNVKSKKKQ